MSTKQGRRSSIRELKPGKKHGRALEVESVAAAQPIAAEPEEAELEAESAEESGEAPATDTVIIDVAAEASPGEVTEVAGEAPAEPDAVAAEVTDDDDVAPSPIEAAMLAELSEGVTDDTEDFLQGLIEALLFSSDRPMPAKELARAAGIDRRRADELVAALRRRYESGGLGIEEVAGGYVMRSSPRYSSYIQKLLALRPVRLSRAQLETLAIVAYRQPVTKPEVDDIRGVDSGQVLKGLLERELLKIVGKKDEPGRPMLYGTTTAFLELLNLQSLKDLPTLREYTELSEESRRKFEEETGEASPEVAPAEDTVAGQTPPVGGAVEGPSLAEDAPTAPAEPPVAAAEPADGEGEVPGELDAAALEGAEAFAAHADDEASADAPESDEGAHEDDVTPAPVEDAPSARVVEAADEDGIDLDALAEISDVDEETPPSQH
jgi:segregation and condensation protein B